MQKTGRRLVVVVGLAALLSGAGVMLYPQIEELRFKTAVGTGNVETLQEMVAAGFDVNHRFGDGGPTAVYYAASMDDTHAVAALLSLGADPDLTARSGENPLMIATAFGSCETVRVILKGGANPNAADSRSGFTALHEAAYRGRKDIAMLLVAAGASTAQRAIDGMNPSAKARQFGRRELADALDAAAAPSGALPMCDGTPLTNR